MTPESSPSNNVTRRQFIATTAVAGAGVMLGANSFAASGERSSSAPALMAAGRRKRYAIVGTGVRHGMYRDAIVRRYSEHAELVGLCDLNEGRLRLAKQRSGIDVPTYIAKDFDRMVREQRPDVVIVTTKDSAHSDYIIRAMELGCDAITEKPMTIDERRCRNIIRAQRRTGRKCTVTFNYRYSPARTQVKDLLMNGTIGDVLSVDFHWMLDTHHGADYFRRWHSDKKSSGGLMVHKATHHFDLVNWWLSAVPVSVMATGKKEYYTPHTAMRMGLQSHHERCHTCPEKDKCSFFLDLAANRNLRELYLENEQYDGYFRDQCVWRPEIDIEDTMNVLVKYNTGVTLAYSLNAFNAWEGYYVIFNGTKGRIEHKIEESISISGDGSTPGAIKGDGTYIRVFPLRAPAYEVDVWTGTGGHGGGDAILLDDLFLPEKPQDKYLRAADQRGGAYSILIGVAANKSFASGRSVEIDDLVSRIGMPDYPAMPTHEEPIPMPPRRRA